MSSTAPVTKGPMSVVLEYYGPLQTKELINFHVTVAKFSSLSSVKFLFEKVVQEFEILIGFGQEYGLEETANKLIRDFANRKFCAVFTSGSYNGGIERVNLNLCDACTRVAGEILKRSQGNFSQTPEMRLHAMLQARGLVSEVSENVPESSAMISSDKDPEPVVELSNDDMLCTESHVRHWPRKRRAAAPRVAAPAPAVAAVPAPRAPVPQEQTLGSTIAGILYAPIGWIVGLFALLRKCLGL